MKNIDYRKRRDYKDWWHLKTYINSAAKRRNYSEREIWWCFVGENIGIEINGKGKSFLRPVLVLRKISALGFIGIPLTSQAHSDKYHIKFTFQGNISYAVISQIKTFSASRLFKRMGQLDDCDFNLVLVSLIGILTKNSSPKGEFGRENPEYNSIIAQIAKKGKRGYN